MNDDEIERRLREVRPAGPPTELRARILAARPQASAWPWAMAAAALLVLSLVLHGVADRAAGRAVPAPDESSELIAGLAELLGGDAQARDTAELIATVDRPRVTPGRSGIISPSRP